MVKYSYSLMQINPNQSTWLEAREDICFLCITVCYSQADSVYCMTENHLYLGAIADCSCQLFLSVYCFRYIYLDSFLPKVFVNL